MGKQFQVSQEVTILGISLFMLGLGLGPLVVGPISEIYGHRAVYSVSFSYFFVVMFPVAFAPNISTSLVCWNHRHRVTPWYNPTAVYLVFRFLAGYFGAAFLSVAGGSVSAMFPNSEVATYVALACTLFLFACQCLMV